MPLYKITGLNLRVQDFGESDKLLTVFSKERGKLRILAKGARKSGSKLSGRTELLVVSRMVIAAGRNLDLLTDSEVIESHEKMRPDLDRINLAFYFIWLLDQMTVLHQALPEVWELAITSLDRVLKNGASQELRVHFEKEMARLEGIKPTEGSEYLPAPYLENYLEKSYPDYFSRVTRGSL
jgi:DNA repair protein RecO (recombination protein O)